MIEPNWTAERTAICLEMWAAGASASMIAGRLGGVSRNAVLGKIHRFEKQQEKQTQIPRTLRKPATTGKGVRKPRLTSIAINDGPLRPIVEFTTGFISCDRMVALIPASLL